MMGGFLEDDYRAATPEIQRAFVVLLNCQDPDIYDWLMGAQVPDNVQLHDLIALLRAKYGLDSA